MINNVKDKRVRHFLIKFFFPILSLLSTCFVSCNPYNEKQTYQNMEFGGQGMEKDKFYTFFFNETDSASNDGKNTTDGKETGEVNLIIRYTARYPHANLLLDINYLKEGETDFVTKRIDIPLFSEEGTAVKENGYGLYTKIISLDSLQVDSNGIELSVSTPIEDTSGLVSLGIITSGFIENHEE